jgi:anti-anti-sigma factor
MKDIYFISREGNFEAIVRAEKDLCLVLLGGTADTNQAGELHDIIEREYLTGKKAFNYIIDIEKLRYISSTGIGMLLGMLDDAKEFVAIASASERMKKNLSTHGLIQLGPDFGYIQAYDTLEDALKAKGASTIFADISLNLKKGLIEGIEYDYREQTILRAYMPRASEEELYKELKKMAAEYKKEIYADGKNVSDEINVPSERKYSVVIFRFLKEAFKKANLYGEHKFDDDYLEITAKELTENAVMWGYKGRKDGVINCRYFLDNERLVIYYTDWGAGYSPSKMETLKSLIRFRISGEGLNRLQNLFDDPIRPISPAPEVSKKTNNFISKNLKAFTPGKGTRITLVKYLILT